MLLMDSILRLVASASCSCPDINVKIPLECSQPNVTKIPPQYIHQNSVQTHNFSPSLQWLLPTLHIILPSSFPRALRYLLPLLLLLHPLHPPLSSFSSSSPSFCLVFKVVKEKGNDISSESQTPITISYKIFLSLCQPTVTSTGHLKYYTTGSLKLLRKCASKLISVPKKQRGLCPLLLYLIYYSDTSANEDNSFRNHIRQPKRDFPQVSIENCLIRSGCCPLFKDKFYEIVKSTL